MRKLNEIMPRVQEQFEAALNEGTVLQLESGDIAWIEDALAEGPDA
jgi:hypothetical protein